MWPEVYHCKIGKIAGGLLIGLWVSHLEFGGWFQGFRTWFQRSIWIASVVADFYMIRVS